MNTEIEIKKFLDIAETDVAKFCFMIWDYYIAPELFDVEAIKSTIRCRYGQHNLIHGDVNPTIFNNMEKTGEIVISTNLNWMNILDDYFTDFKLIDDNWTTKFYNSFYCMELSYKDFERKETYESRRFSSNEEKILPMNRKIHLNSGLGGVGVIEDQKLLACAFAPHVVKNNLFSFAIMRDVWTKPSHRGRGLGFDVSSNISNLAFDVGLEKVYLWVEQHNAPAVHIYKKMGFKITSTAYSVICKKL